MFNVRFWIPSEVFQQTPDEPGDYELLNCQCNTLPTVDEKIFFGDHRCSVKGVSSRIIDYEDFDLDDNLKEHYEVVLSLDDVTTDPLDGVEM